MMPSSSRDATTLRVHEEQVCVLQSPLEYFQQLKTLLRISKREVIFSALYFGTGEQEVDLLTEVKTALTDESRPQLQISLLLDHSRSQRGSISSLHLLGPLCEKYPGRFHVYLYQMPLLRSWYMSYLPFQLREVLGVYHCKFCIADHRVLLTGANLSDEYFNNRQDRYWMINGNSMVDFLASFAKIVMADSSYLLSPTSIRSPNISNLAVCEKALKELQLSHPCDLLESESTDASSIRCVPIVQHSSLSIYAEESSMCRLLQSLSQSFNDIRIKIATPYTNFPPKLLEGVLSVIRKGGNVEILGPGSSSHGFAKGKGLKGYIPQLHEAALHSSFHEASDNTKFDHIVSDNAKSIIQEIKFLGYERETWTYHAKGLWFQAKERSSGKDFCGTYIGSSNFGIRSWVRDFELGFIFLGATPSQSKLQHADYDHIRSFCVETDKKAFSNHEARSFSNSLIRIISKLIKGYL